MLYMTNICSPFIKLKRPLTEDSYTASLHYNFFRNAPVRQPCSSVIPPNMKENIVHRKNIYLKFLLGIFQCSFEVVLS